MNDADRKTAAYLDCDRPAIALITNHGYAGAEIPFGGAPDTGGQNLYVNSLARALDDMGYKVTVFARGGFPYFESSRMRSEPEFITDFVRYIFVPGGGDAFLRKEDIAVALDEEIEWLYAFMHDEARDAGRDPWDLYEVINSHYWDAGVIGVRLVERWRNDIAARDLAHILESVVPEHALHAMVDDRHWLSVGDASGYTIGRLLLEAEPQPSSTLTHRVAAAISRWTAVKGGGAEAETYLIDTVQRVLETAGEQFPPDLRPILAANALGPAALSMCPDVDARLRMDLHRVDRHVWTPHSVGELKDYNFRSRPDDVRRSLKFCERRDHERMICSRTRAFAATSTGMAEWLWTHYRIPIEQTFYFPPCLDTHRFRPYDEQDLDAAYAYLAECTRLPVERLREAPILFETSRMDRTKRKDLLLAAFGRIVRDRDDALLLIGGGPVNEVTRSLREQIRFTESLHDRAFLLGPIPEEHIAQMFSLADIYVTPSEMEGFGMCASQAAAAGTALVSSDLVPFAVHHVPEESLICPAGDARAFAEAIGHLLEEPGERKDRGARLAERVRPFDWVSGTRGFLAHLRQHGMEIAEGRPVSATEAPGSVASSLR